KVKVGPPFWTAKKIFIASMFAASAVSLGTGIWQNGSVNNKTKTANKLYETARNSAIDQNRDDYNVYAKAYEDKIDSRYNSVIARNSLYLAATGFAAVGVVYIVF
ncbi:MAG: hypothetical protein FWC26_01570, partial [Fibromonadales bacterium]|nr:hypothetical protein [Fibromonadales bacterium]